jgi:hypothetical protein
LGQGEIKGRALVNFSFGPQTAAVALDDTLGQGQAYAGAIKILDGMQPLKDPE